ncbi:MAG: pyruvate ferredoxin oxidoreductase subunit gamma [Nitrososphaerota archaeon]|nr:pyruvate ferredoxin oxidoreductase subunit gamma [Candidatus Bathyarchaeota archaeon]MDW8022846.1 pyruvate ferredoxin oxidoreductase subunit gamma [Nitrososphaerota archaeon]
MKEVRFHGRGGQGAVTAARILASAMFFEGKNVQAFPVFGLERRGSPVEAFLRYSVNEPIPVRTYVHNPDCIVVFDQTLFKTVKVLDGLKEDGLLLINTSMHPSKLNLKVKRVAVVDATSISLKTLGTPIVNTVMCGAFAAATKDVSLSSVLKTIRERFAGNLAENNEKAAAEGYRETKIYHGET